MSEFIKFSIFCLFLRIFTSATYFSRDGMMGRPPEDGILETSFFIDPGDSVWVSVNIPGAIFLFSKIGEVRMFLKLLKALRVQQ